MPDAIRPAVGPRAPLPARIVGALRGAGRFIARAGRAVADKFPLTPLGLLLLAAAYLVQRELGRKHQDVVLYVVGLGALAVILTAALLVGGTTLYLIARTARLPAREHLGLDAGRIDETDFSLPSLGLLPLISLSWQWVWPHGVKLALPIRKGRFVEEITFHERGEHLLTVRRFVVEDVLGLARLAWTVRQSTPRTIRPSLGRPLAAPLLESFSGGDAVSHPAGPPDGDLVDMRRYAAGDPMKRILWKVYARTRDLMVRLPERAISPTKRTLAYLAAGEGDEAAAAVARLAVESEALGPEWRFSADQTAGAATTESHDALDPAGALQLIIGSRDARGQGGEGLAPFLDRNASWGGRCVIFASARAGRWVSSVEEQARRRPGQIEVVLGVDGLRGAPSADRWRRLFLVENAEELSGSGARADEVDALSRRLVGAGATVTVVDRPTGKVYGRSSRRRRA